jgi:hypothetical protein
LEALIAHPLESLLELTATHRYRQSIVIVKRKEVLPARCTCNEFYLRGLGEGELLLPLPLELLPLGPLRRDIF